MKPMESLLRSLIREQIYSNTLLRGMRRLTEGGGAFPEVNSVVPRDLLSLNIDNALSLSGLEDMEYEVVGNKTKDFFGDIDIAVDVQKMRELLGIKSDQEIWPALKSMLDGKVTYRVQPGLSQFHILSDLIDSQGPVNAIDPESHEQLSGVSGKIQVDVFVGSLQWMRDTSSGAPPESGYKAVYRNFLLFAIIGAVPANLTSDEAQIAAQYPDKLVKKKILTNFRKGVIERLYYEETVTGKTGKPLKDPKIVVVNERINPDANQISSLFLKRTVPWEDFNSYEELFNQFNSNNFKFPALREKILETFKSDLKKNSLKIPDNI